MNEPSDEDLEIEEILQRMPPWLRALMKFVVMPVTKGLLFIGGLFCIRCEIVPVDELPAAKERWGDSPMDPKLAREWVEERHPFLCPECDAELKPDRQDAEELFPDVWEVRKYARCESCAADREHCSRLHHGYLLFRQDDRWQAIFPRVPFLRRCWLRLFG